VAAGAPSVTPLPYSVERSRATTSIPGRWRSQCGRGAVRQEIDHTVPLQIHDNGAVIVSLALRPIVHANDAGRFGLIRQGQAANQPQHGGGARRHRQPRQQPRTRPTAQGHAGPALSLGQSMRAPGEGRHQARQAFSEGPAGAGCVAAIEAVYAQAQTDRAPK